MPVGVTGPDLLVNLTTERVIQKRKLKENWEVPGGWEYEDLRAIVACALGDSYATALDRDRAAEVEKRTLKSLMKSIRKHGAPPLCHQDDTGLTPTPEAYYTVLILGMFDETNPRQIGEKDESGAMGKELAKLLEVPENKIKARPFEHAKTEVVDRYQNHLERQKLRAEFRSRQASDYSGVKTRGKLSQEQALQLVLGQLARQGIPGMPATAARKKEIAGFLMKLGIKVPR